MNLEPSIFDLQDQNGVDFDFISQNTYTQTALVEIDRGFGDVESYRIATNVTKDGFEYQGISMAEVLTDVLGLPYTVAPHAVPQTGTNADGQQQTVRVLTEIDGLTWQQDGMGNTTAAWLVIPKADLGTTFVADGYQLGSKGNFVVYPADQDTDEVREIYRRRLKSGANRKLNSPLVKGGDIFLD